MTFIVIYHPFFKRQVMSTKLNFVFIFLSNKIVKHTNAFTKTCHKMFPQAGVTLLLNK